MKTPQELFNNVWKYFVVQKNPQAMLAYRGVESCAYRGDKSNCAIGCQLPDELYFSELERMSIFVIMNKRDDRCQKITDYFGEDNMYFLDSLQRIHDKATNASLELFLNDIELKLREFAVKQLLEIP